MANDNKKINDLVSENDDDTSELEVLTATVVFDRNQRDEDYEAESDAATHSFETSAKSTAADDASIAALKSDLQKREENISNLQYDIEQLRARWTGLEKELKAREDLTDNVTTELEQSNRKLAQTISLLKKRDSKIAALETTLEQQSARVAEAETAIEQARGEAGSLRAEMEAIRNSDQAARNSIASLNAELAAEMSARKRAEDSEQAQALRLEQLEVQHDESRLVVATLQQYVEGRKRDWSRQEAELKSTTRSLKEQRKENARLAREARVAAERLRKEAAARQKLQTERDSLQTGLQQSRTEARAATESLDAALQSQRAQQEQIASLAKQIEEAAPALEEEQGERRRLEKELDEQQRQGGLWQAELSALQQSYAAKDALLAEQQDTIQELTLALATAGEELVAEQARRSALEKQLAPLQEEAAGLRMEHARLKEEAAKNDRLLYEETQEAARLSREFESVRLQLESEQSAHHALKLHHEELQHEATQLRAEAASLRTAAGKVTVLEKANAELSGLVSSSDGVIKQLKGQIAKTEGYADVLRMKLQQQKTETEALSSTRDEATASLAEALRRIDELAAQLEAEQQLSARLRLENENATKLLEEEVSRVRFELDAAQETVAEKETQNRQLTAELVESTGMHRTLEERLLGADQARDRDIRDLSRQVAQFRQQIDDYERKISTKDAAINALLTELAHKPESPEDNAAADDVVHRLADRKSQSAEDRGYHENRVTRLLIGNIDGQELRFPLFKDKLTIGRTVHNDIQLKAQYVSRRHAVVVTEEDRTRIVDWGSKNGIYVNGRRVSEHMLRNGDRVSVGTAEFKYEERPKR